MTAPSASTAAHAPGANPTTYLWIWGWLAGLMLLGVLLAEKLTASKQVVVLAIMGLSSVKAVLVGAYYMHLKFDRRWLTYVALSPLLVIALAVLLVSSSRMVRL